MAVHVPLTELYRMPVAEYHRLIESGGLDEDTRVELLGGLIVAMSPKTPAHERVLTWLTRWLYAHADLTRYEVGVQRPLTLSDSEPEPDLALIEFGTAAPYHPATAALVIEVAVSSQRRDLHDKPPLYAAAAVPDYWVVDVDNRQAWAHRDPAASDYATVERLGEDDELTAASLSLGVRVADILAAAG